MNTSEYPFIEKQDPEVYAALLGEEERQKFGLELIPSENYVSRAVREANSSIFTNKYSEGYPGKRYYGGQHFTDIVENVARDRVKKLFNCGYANVQPHAGAPANVALYFALLEPGDTILGLDLSHGGHLTHGHPLTHVAKVFKFIGYKMKNPDTGEFDFDEIRRLAIEHKPKLLLAGFSAYSRELDYAKFAEIAKEVGALTMMDAAHVAGLIAGKAHKNPFDYGFDIITSTTHKTLRGPRGGMILTNNETIAKKVDKSIFPGLQGGPLMNAVAAKAVCFGEALSPKFEVYAHQVIKNAQAMAKVFQDGGVRLMGGGTDNHLVLADLRALTIDGHTAETLLDTVGITLNKNMVADDSGTALKPSGIRFGTPAITTRGFAEKECIHVAEIMLSALKNPADVTLHRKLHQEVRDLASAFPIPDVMI